LRWTMEKKISAWSGQEASAPGVRAMTASGDRPARRLIAFWPRREDPSSTAQNTRSADL
jgi:hypothetical protein